MCDTYNYDYLKYSTFRFNFIDFQLYNVSQKELTPTFRGS